MGKAPSLKRMFLKALHGGDAHVNPHQVFEELDWTMAGETPSGCPHSIWQTLNHLIYWQEFCLALLRGENPPAPTHASDTWISTMRPRNAEEWKNAVDVFLEGLQRVANTIDSNLEEQVVALPGTSRAEIIGTVMLHNSYHLGQIVLLRRMLGTWPPTSGGDTW